MLVKVNFPSGVLYLNPSAVAAVTDFVDGARGPIVGCSMVYTVGGTALMVPLPKNELARVLSIGDTLSASEAPDAGDPFDRPPESRLN